ncbi:maleylpyruvate isomerase N-terminal domain-containing protein [Streptosporangium canum]|uniref:maleylpyruvate isomerase N-terminal domain-containing protein n=1 Tax=Streptosporangium canum TaxID=324952 RepID=UPI0033A0DE27
MISLGGHVGMHEQHSSNSMVHVEAGMRSSLIVKTMLRPIPHQVALTAFTEAFTALDELATSLDDILLMRSSRCQGWAVCDVLYHLHLGAQDVLVALALPTEAEPDSDFVSVWRGNDAGTDTALANVHFVRLVASAYRKPTALVAHLSATVRAVVRRAGEVPKDTRIEQGGQVLSVGDFLAQWAVEAAIHHLDITVDLGDVVAPAASALAVVQRTFDGLAGSAVDLGWDDVTYALKGSGRLPLAESERKELGPLANRFPLIG